MLHLRALLVTAFAVAVFAAGCSETVDPSSSNTTLLTSTTWVTTKYTIGGQNDVGPTSQDFNSDGTYSAVVLGATKTGSWEFNVDETNLIITEGSTPTSWEIRALTSTSLKLRYGTGSNAIELEAVPQ